ncbi:MAG: hypothetical protein ACLFU5_06800, partial [Thermoplasmata archaeon]
MSESCSKEVASTTIFSQSSDSTDSDFIQDHIDSFFPPGVSEEVIEKDEDDDDSIPDTVPDDIADRIEDLNFTVKDFDEDNEEASGPVVSVISGEVEDADEAEEILDMLLYREYDEEEGEFENRSANRQVLETPQTAGLATDLIQLIPWTGFEMDEIDEDGPDDWILGEWMDYVVDVVKDAVDMLVSDFAYVRDLLQTIGEVIVEWGMAVIGAIGEA